MARSATWRLRRRRLVWRLRRRVALLRHRRGSLVLPRSVRIGPGFRIVTFGAGGRLVVGEDVEFRHNCVIELNHDSEVAIGAGTVLTYNVVVQAAASVTIGANCLFAAGASVVDSK